MCELLEQKSVLFGVICGASEIQFPYSLPCITEKRCTLSIHSQQQRNTTKLLFEIHGMEKSAMAKHHNGKWETFVKGYFDWMVKCV